jgi:hypothetical protein
VIEKGKQRAKALSWALGKASTGTVQIGVEFSLLDKPGESITWYGYLSDKAFELTIKALRACGWEGADLAELERQDCGLDKNEVVLVIEHEEYPENSGQWQAKVAFVNSGGGVAMKTKLQGDDLKAFAAEMKGRILAMDPSSAAKRAASKPGNGGKPPAGPAARPEPPPVDDRDIPF